MKKAVIMAGGFGTRLRPLTMSIPKPMVPLMNIPMMGHIVNLLTSHNINDIVTLLYYQPEVVTSYFGDGSNFGVSMKYVLAAADYGTAGAVRNGAEYLGERFIIISGDVLTDFDITEALDFHIKRGSMATLLLTRHPNPLQFGIVMTDTQGKITRFLEKPSWGEVFSDTINTGIYILEPEVLDLIPYQRDFDFSKDLFPLMLRNNLPLYGYITDGYWRDIGNLNEYQIACMDVLEHKVKVSMPGERCDSAFVGRNCTLSPSAHLSGTVLIGNNVTIGDGAQLHNVVLGNNVTIGAGSSLSGAVLWDDIVIGDRSSLTNDVLCDKIRIGNDVVISENVFIAEGCVIGDGAQLMSNIKLWPHKTVEGGAMLNRSLVQEEKWLRELFTDARITGLSNIEVNPEFAAKLGAAIGNALGAGSVVVGSRDADNASRMTHRAIMSGLMSAGLNVNDLQLTSIPQTRQELRNGKAAAGFHVRRSIRQPNKTDIVLFSSDGRDFPSAKSKTIERFFFGEDIKRVDFSKVGTIRFPERSNEAYLNRFLDVLNVDAIRHRHFRTMIDYSHGLAATAFPQILGQLNCSVVAMNAYIDPERSFSDTMTDMEAEEGSTVMRSLGYEVGFKIDAAAERIAIVDAQGKWYSPQRLLTIVVKLFLEANKETKQTIAVPVQTSNEVDIIAAQYDADVIRIKNTHSAMIEATQNKDINFVGDPRGRLIFPQFLFASDAMFSIAKIMEMLACTGLNIMDLERTLPRRIIMQRNVPCPWERKGTVMRKAMEFSDSMERQLIDGVKMFQGSNSVLLLPDKELASFFVIAESDNEEEAHALTTEYAAKVQEWSE